MNEHEQWNKMAEDYLGIIMHRGTATYKNGKLDFTTGEGNNNHVRLIVDGEEAGYIWLDTHCGGDTFAFCGKSSGNCRGRCKDILQNVFPDVWETECWTIKFSAEQFVLFMDTIIASIR